jgi:hypothetical protein
MKNECMYKTILKFENIINIKTDNEYIYIYIYITNYHGMIFI